MALRINEPSWFKFSTSSKGVKRYRRETYPDLITNHLGQLVCVCEISIVRDADTIRVVGVKRLGFSARARTSCGVSHMTKADIAPQLGHVMYLKDILD